MTAEASSLKAGPLRTLSRDLLAPVLKEAGIAALVAFGLAVFMIGFRTVDAQGGLQLETRWSWVGIAVGAVFVGRLALALRRHWRRADQGPGILSALSTRLGAG